MANIVEVLNSKIISQSISDWNIDDKALAEEVNKVIPKSIGSGKINIAFVSLNEIKRLNLEYRNIDNPTDVLSFQYEDADMRGEIYISPEYISQAYTGRDAVLEILRCIVHGLLHLAGEEHKGHFEGKANEPMFEKQESMLDSIINQLKI